MSESAGASPHTVALSAAAEMLQLPEDGVRALAVAGYLRATGDGPDGPHFALGDLKALLARLADTGTPDVFLADPEAVDPQALLDALDGRAEEMARRAYGIFQTVFPEAARWSLSEQARFVEQARRRFEAILAVTGQGQEVDEALVTELEEVGAAAAWAGSPLPQLLVVLRISRDLVVQTAVEIAEERGRHWGLALSLLLTRVLPAIDRLTDAIAQGYWAAVVGREEEALRRYESVVEHSSDGIYEVDVDGRIKYANPSFAVIVGRRLEDLDGAHLTDVLTGDDRPGVAGLLAPRVQRVEMSISRRDGVRRLLDIRAQPRHEEGAVAGYQGVVRDVTAANELETRKNEFLALITQDLRQPLTTILGLGATLETHAGELGADRVARMGASIRQQSERIARLADDLYDVSRLQTSTLSLNPRRVELSSAVAAALETIDTPGEIEVRVPDDLVVHADARRVEQVVANLVENALVHGEPPVRIEARPVGDDVELEVTDVGSGVPDAVLPTLFSRLRTASRRDRDRARGTGLGLALVRGLVEGMGGRVWYERAPGGGASFKLCLPASKGALGARGMPA